VSQMDAEDNVLSEAKVREDNTDDLKFVPVAESIRYRKRAQSAEKKNLFLAEELAQAKAEAAKLSEQLSDIQIEQQLTHKLAAAGTVDLETAVLLAKARIGGREDADLDGVIEQLKREKQHLFFDHVRGVVSAKKTSPAKDGLRGNQTALERAAKRAAATGGRADLQEYLKLRRSFA